MNQSIIVIKYQKHVGITVDTESHSKFGLLHDDDVYSECADTGYIATPTLLCYTKYALFYQPAGITVAYRTNGINLGRVQLCATEATPQKIA